MSIHWICYYSLSFFLRLDFGFLCLDHVIQCSVPPLLHSELNIALYWAVAILTVIPYAGYETDIGIRERSPLKARDDTQVDAGWAQYSATENSMD